jgi:catechol 2,3-dioxygenase-like lactoylglutathione lyase family enzyme
MSNPAFKFDHVHIISQDPEASANWYVEMFGATITANTTARGAPQIFVDLGGMTILIRGQRPGEAPVAARPIRQFADFSSHDARGIDHFGFMYQGDLTAFCDKLRAKGVSFPVELKKRGWREPAVLCRSTRRREHRVDAVLTEMPTSFLAAISPKHEGRASRSARRT